MPLLLDHAEVVNCTSGGPGHMKCSITCQRGFALQASSGQYLRPMQVSWKPMVIRTKPLGRDSRHVPPPGWMGERHVFLNHLKGKMRNLTSKEKHGFIETQGIYKNRCSFH